jgi:cyclase
MARRATILGTLVAAAAASMVVAAAQAPAPSPAAIANAKIEKVRDNLYVITGSSTENFDLFSGGNTAVFITDAGVVLVDTKIPNWGPTLVERVRSVTSKPITTIINTHAHGDHTGSNEFFPNVQAVVHENTKSNMARAPEFAGQKAKFLPARTYRDRLTLGSGQDRVELYYFGPAHTSGDTFVVFPALRVMHAGDVFAWKALPYTDVDNGGSPIQHPETIARALKAIPNVDTVIAGHIPLMTWADFREYGEFSADFANQARAAFKAGKTAEQAAKEYRVPARFKGYQLSAIEQVTPLSNFTAAFNELQKR